MTGRQQPRRCDATSARSRVASIGGSASAHAPLKMCCGSCRRSPGQFELTVAAAGAATPLRFAKN
eukprot:5741936-Pyramimonas_sp.AAC.1